MQSMELQTAPQAFDEAYFDEHRHMFERKRNLSRDSARLYKRFSESYCLSFVLSYLG